MLIDSSHDSVVRHSAIHDISCTIPFTKLHSDMRSIMLYTGVVCIIQYTICCFKHRLGLTWKHSVSLSKLTSIVGLGLTLVWKNSPKNFTQHSFITKIKTDLVGMSYSSSILRYRKTENTEEGKKDVYPTYCITPYLKCKIIAIEC